MPLHLFKPIFKKQQRFKLLLFLTGRCNYSLYFHILCIADMMRSWYNEVTVFQRGGFNHVLQ